MRLNTTSPSSRGMLWLLLAMLSQSSFAGAAQAQANAPMELTLSQAIDLALQQNRQIKLAQLAVVDSEHKKAIARSAYFPHIKNESTVLHITELEGVSFPAGAFGSPPATGPIPSQSLVIAQGGLTAYTSGTGLAQPLTQMFKIHESNRAATADINSAKIQVNQAQDEIALKVRQLYYGILIAQLKEQAAKAEVDASQVKLQESTDAVAQGKALEVAALDSRAALLDAKQSALTQSLQAQDLTLELDDLLGLPLDHATPAERRSVGRNRSDSLARGVRSHRARAKPRHPRLRNKPSKKRKPVWPQPKTPTSQTSPASPGTATRAECLCSCTTSAPSELLLPTTSSTAAVAAPRSPNPAHCSQKRSSTSPKSRTKLRSRLKPPTTGSNNCKASSEWPRKS